MRIYGTDKISHFLSAPTLLTEELFDSVEQSFIWAALNTLKCVINFYMNTFNINRKISL